MIKSAAVAVCFCSLLSTVLLLGGGCKGQRVAPPLPVPVAAPPDPVATQPPAPAESVRLPPVREWKTEFCPVRLAFTPDQSGLVGAEQLYVHGIYEDLRRWNLADRTDRVLASANPSLTAFSLGDRVAAAAVYDVIPVSREPGSRDEGQLPTYRFKGLCLIDLDTGERRPLPKMVGESNGALALSPDGRLIATGKELTIFQAGDGKVLYRAQDLPQGQLTDAIFAADGNLLAVFYRCVDADPFILLIDPVGKCERRIPLPGKQHQELRLALSPDGRLLAGVSLGVGYVWNTTDGRQKYRLDLACGFDGGLAFSPDGKVVAVPTGFGDISLWDMASGSKKTSFKAFDWPKISAVAFSPDGTRLAAAGEDFGPVPVNGQAPPNRLLRVWEVAQLPARGGGTP